MYEIVDSLEMKGMWQGINAHNARSGVKPRVNMRCRQAKN